MDTITINGQEITPEVLTIESRDEKLYLQPAPLPEYILVSDDFWDEAEEWTPEDEWPPSDDPETPPELWIEPLGHADEDKDNDGYVLHIDATNVHAAYKLLQENPDGTRLLVLVSWAER